MADKDVAHAGRNSGLADRALHIVSDVIGPAASCGDPKLTLVDQGM